MSGFGTHLLWHLVESTLIALVFVASVRLMGIRSSDALCWVYRLSLLKFAIPTVWLFSIARHRFLELESTGTTIIFGPLQDAARSVAAIAEATEPIRHASILGIGLLSLGGAILGLGVAWAFGQRLVSGGRYHWRVRASEKPFGPREARILNTCLSENLGIDGVLVDAGPGIGLYGIFRPRIIARHAFLDSLSDEELATAFQHEVAHRVRRDNLWCVFTEVVACLFWFHPLVWELRKRMFFEMEKACDEQVISKQGNSSGYANCLLKAASFSNQGEIVGALALSESFLKRRVRNVIEYQYIKLSKMKLFLANIVGVTLLLGSFALSAFADVSLSNPLEDTRSVSPDGEELSRIDRERERRVETQAEVQLKQRLAEMEARMKELMSDAEADKRRLQAEFQAGEREMLEMRAKILEEQKAAMARAHEIRAEALKQAELATKSLAVERERFEKERQLQREESFKERSQMLERLKDLESQLREDQNSSAKVYNLKDLDKLPRALFQVDPVYPPELKKAGIKGWVQVEWIITDQGGVERVTAIESSREEFEAPSVTAIEKSKWAAGKKDGKAVNVRVRQRLDYNP